VEFCDAVQKEKALKESNQREQVALWRDGMIPALPIHWG
jgi:hypothetical protein